MVPFSILLEDLQEDFVNFEVIVNPKSFQSQNEEIFKNLKS